MFPVRGPVECLSLTQNQRFPSEYIDPQKRTQRNPGSLPSLARCQSRRVPSSFTLSLPSLCLALALSLSRSLSLSFSLFLRSLVSGLHFVRDRVVQLELFVEIWVFEHYYCFLLALKIAFQYAILKLCFLLLLLYFPSIVVPTLSVSTACRVCTPSGYVDSEVSSGVHEWTSRSIASNFCC
jgi:hypothetical protein